jgi:hypothetical protein
MSAAFETTARVETTSRIAYQVPMSSAPTSITLSVFVRTTPQNVRTSRFRSSVLLTQFPSVDTDLNPVVDQRHDHGKWKGRHEESCITILRRECVITSAQYNTIIPDLDHHIGVGLECSKHNVIFSGQIFLKTVVIYANIYIIARCTLSHSVGSAVVPLDSALRRGDSDEPRRLRHVYALCFEILHEERNAYRLCISDCQPGRRTRIFYEPSHLMHEMRFNRTRLSLWNAIACAPR